MICPGKSCRRGFTRQMLDIHKFNLKQRCQCEALFKKKMHKINASITLQCFHFDLNDTLKFLINQNWTIVSLVLRSEI